MYKQGECCNLLREFSRRHCQQFSIYVVPKKVSQTSLLISIKYSSIWNNIFPNGIMKLQKFLKCIFGILDWGLLNSFWDHVIQISITRQMNFQYRVSQLCKVKIFCGNISLLLRNSYECPIWIFIFNTDRARMNSSALFNVSENFPKFT